jgi:transcriptional regulator with GAF, ATPase, and Fis domain
LALNCAAVPESLLESELFGHEKGSFTGAVATKIGLFEQAHGGTLFLDEVGEMPASVQAKLLRVLETRSIIRVGDTRPRSIDIRLVAATHRDLDGDIKSGRFRQDLFFRIAGAKLWIPPLRDRPRELPLLARRFLEQACVQMGRPTPVLTAGALARLSSHRWSGNARELKNVMEYFAATCEGMIDGWQVASHLESSSQPVPPASPEAPVQSTFRPLAEELRELEERRMLEALNAHDWNQTRAAQAISMPLRTFVTRFKQLELAKKRVP